MATIDVIVPSYRLQSKYLVAILQMDIPKDTIVRFLIIADNPKAVIPKEVESQIDNKKVLLFRNPENLGVCKTRNVGIDNAIADWVLLLDDDVVPSKTLLVTYAKAIEEGPDEVGFFGDVVFPSPINGFTNGVRACGMMALFSVPNQNFLRKWTPTANVMVKHSAIGNIRFNEIFAKAGAGEEIDFFLRICKNANSGLRGIKNAQVYHDWWYAGKRTYSRFFRWNTGIALLPGIFPEYSYYTFPNMLECLFIGLPVTLIACLFLHSFSPLLCVFLGVIIGDCFIEFVHLLKTRGISQSKFVIEVVLIRAANDLGRIVTTPSGICRRFNLACESRNISSQRFWAGLKFVAYILFSMGFYCIIKLTLG